MSRMWTVHVGLVQGDLAQYDNVVTYKGAFGLFAACSVFVLKAAAIDLVEQRD